MPSDSKMLSLCSTVTVRAEEGDSKKLPSFTGMAYTGAEMTPGGWYGRIILDLGGIRIAKQQRPILKQHDHEKIVGHSESITVDDKGIAVAGVFSGQDSPHAKEIISLAKNGFPWQMSVGATPMKTHFVEAGEKETVNGREVTGPITVSDVTELGEISFVPLGADGDTSAVVSASKGRASMFKAMLKAAKTSGNVKAGKYNDDEVEKMSEEDAKAALKKCMADDDEDAKAKAKAEEDAKAKAKAEEDKGKDAEARISQSIAAATQKGIEAGRKAQADEAQRVSDIQARCKRHGVVTAEIELPDGKKGTVNLVSHAITAGWTGDQTELHALRAARPSGPHLHFPQSPVMNEAVLECAVFDALPSFKLFDKDFYQQSVDDRGRPMGRRCSEREERRITAELNTRYTDQVRQAAHTHFRSRIGLQQLLTTLAAANGYQGPQTFNDPSGWGEVAAYLGNQIRADGPSTVNTPATLSNVQNKFMLQGYMYTEQSFMEFCQVLPVKDLKPTKSVQLFGDFQFQPLNPAGEMAHASVGDNPYANQAGLEARMIQLGLQYLINDDLNMFGQIPMMLGRGWGLRVNDLVYSKLNNPGNDEGGSTAFFAATHTITGQKANSNLSSGAGSALTSDGLKAAKILLDKQVDPAGKPLGIDAEILLYPPELDVPAIELMNAQFIVMAGLASTSAASKQANTNIWKGRFRPVMSRYLSDATYAGSSTTGWYLLANPNIIPVIQIAALNGQMTPMIQQAGQDWNFNMLGISMRGWGGVGVGMQNFRGGVKSAGS